LSSYKANVGYTIVVEAGSNVSATAAKDSIVATTSANLWMSKIKAAMTAKSINVTVSNVVASAPTVATDNASSLAQSMYKGMTVFIFAVVLKAF